MANLDILYFDDVISERDVFEPIWQSILQAVGEAIDIRYEPSLTGLAAKLAGRPHLVILDNAIEETDASGKRQTRNNEGARFIAEHKDAHPDSIFLLHTSKDFEILQLGQRIPNPDMIITKDYMQIKGYQEYIARELQRRLTRLPLDVTIDGGGKREAAQQSAVRSLVEQVVYNFLPTAGHERWTNARLHKLSGGFSGAAVYRLDLTGGTAGPAVPTVLKLGPAEQIEREIAAFLQYAKWYLPHDMRVDIVGKGAIGEQSALCYAFALGSQDRVEPMADALRRGKKCADDVIKQLFLSRRQGWYVIADTVPESPIKTYFNNLDEYPHSKDEWRDTCFEESLKAMCEKEKIKLSKSESRLKFGDYAIDEIRRAFSRLPAATVPMCICHGDLNANNIFHSKRPGIALIDFEQTGLHHVFRDFISFESSVRSLFQPVNASVVPFEELMALETDLLEDVESEVKSSAVLLEVQKIRCAAFERFPNVHRAVYTAALALHLWKLLGFREEGKSIWHSSGERHLTSGLTAALASFNRP